MSSSQRKRGAHHHVSSRPETNDDTLTRLPQEILERIGKHVVELRDIESLSKTNTRLKELMKDSLDKARAEKKRIMNGDACKSWVNFGKLADVWKNDPDVVLRATDNDWRSLSVASKELRNNPDFMAKAVQHKGLGLRFATQTVKDNDDIVFKAVAENGLALKFASERLRDNDDIVSEALEENGLALKFASERLRDNDDIVSEALEENGMALKFASERLRDNDDIVSEALEENGMALEFAGPEPQDKEEIVKLAMQNYKADGHYHLNNPFQYASDRLQSTKDFVMDLIREDGYYCLKYASDQLWDDYDVMTLAIDGTFKKKGEEEAMAPYWQASERLKESHPEICPENPDYYVQSDYTIEAERKRRVEAGIEDDQGNQIFP